MCASDFGQSLERLLHPADRPAPDAWRSHYAMLHEVARELAPRRVCEIGVRAGYSAFAILSANPAASMLGIEADLDESREWTHGGRKDYWRHACQILELFNYRLLIADSKSIQRLPDSDLIYVDGDHSFDGCLSDLRLAERSTNTILVDDVGLIPSVREACGRFAEQFSIFRQRHIDNASTGLLLFQRAHDQHRLIA